MLKVWIFWSPLLYFNFESFLDPNSSSFIRFQCILHDSEVLFSESWNFYKLKSGGPNFWGEPILLKVLIFWSHLLYFNFKSVMDPNSLSFNRFQCIRHDSAVLFWESWNFYILHDSGVLFSESRNFNELKRVDLKVERKQFCRKSRLFGAPFCISILRVLRTQVLRHSLDFSAFFMIQECFSQRVEISTN